MDGLLSLSAWMIALHPRLHYRRAAHRSEPYVVVIRRVLCGAVPQHSAAGADVHLVLRLSGTAAAAMGDAFKQSNPLFQQFLAALVCLGLFTAPASPSRYAPASSRLPPGQRNAGLALGLHLGQTYRYVLMPVAYRIIIPPLTSRIPQHLQELGCRYDHRLAGAVARRRGSSWNIPPSPMRRSSRSRCSTARQRHRDDRSCGGVEREARACPAIIGGDS